MRYVRYTANINADCAAADWLQSWKATHTPTVKNMLLDMLADDHPGLTALVIVQGAQDGTLTLFDCNEIANYLIEARRLRCVE